MKLFLFLRKQVEGNAPVRSGSFATPSFFNERIYELHDNSGSVMNTPTFYPPTNRGEDYFNTSRSMHQVSCSLLNIAIRKSRKRDFFYCVLDEPRLCSFSQTTRPSPTFWKSRSLTERTNFGFSEINVAIQSKKLNYIFRYYLTYLLGA